MFSSVVWIDSKHVKIFNISAEGIKKIHHELSKDKSSNYGHNGVHKKTVEESFFKKIISEITSADEIVVFGSGPTHIHFKHYLEQHNKSLVKKVVANETLEEMTDNQILEKSRPLFKKFNLYNDGLEPIS